MSRNRKIPKRNRKTSRAKKLKPTKAPFLQHVLELRRRLVWIVLSIIVFSFIGYLIQGPIIDWLLKPAADQKFIYTTPGGGINFILQISFYFGVAVSLPIAFYHLFRFIEPLLKKNDNAFIIKCTLFSVVLAASGIGFGYYVGLPAAMHFLESQLKGNSHIEALLTLNDYLSFVTVYLAGAAIMFQLPVIVLFINRITPLNPKKLLKGERWVILISFIVAAIITPTPDLFNQSIVAVPIILIYQLGIVLVWFQNRYSKHQRVQRLFKEDRKRQEIRNKIEHQLITPGAPYTTPRA